MGAQLSAAIPIVEQMAAIGKQVLQGQGAPVNDMRFGFHWPPFQAVRHLRLRAWLPQFIFFSLNVVPPFSESGYWQ